MTIGLNKKDRKWLVDIVAQMFPEGARVSALETGVWKDNLEDCATVTVAVNGPDLARDVQQAFRLIGILAGQETVYLVTDGTVTFE